MSTLLSVKLPEVGWSPFPTLQTNPSSTRRSPRTLAVTQSTGPCSGLLRMWSFIGGPLHGRVVDFVNNKILYAAFPPSYPDAFPMAPPSWEKPEHCGISCYTTEYVRRTLACGIGSVSIRGDCWVWVHATEPPHVLLSMLIIGSLVAQGVKV